MLELLARLEETSPSIWLRESGPAFFGSLILHSLAMAIVVGINIALALRLIGFTATFPLDNFRAFFRLHWIGVCLIIASGFALLLAYPAKALSNPLFYGKLLALSLALALFARVQRAVLGNGDYLFTSRARGYLLLVLWLAVIFAGRFLAYTNSVLLASSFY